MIDYKNKFKVYGKRAVNQKRQLFSFKNSFLRTIPAPIRFISLVSLLMVSAATFYSINKINQLEKSTNSLLHIAVPLKELTHSLEDNMKKIEFLLHKYMVLKDQGYYSATLDEIEKQKLILNKLTPFLKEFPETRSSMEALHAGINNYWKRIHELKNHPSDVIPRALENIIKFDIKDFNHLINTLAEEQAAATKNAAEHVTDVLLLLIIGTVISGVGISFLYAVAAIRPMQRIRKALKRIGEGHYDENLNLEGLQELRVLSHEVNNMQMKLRKLELAKTESLSLISHELKTPLASFQSGIDLLFSGGAGTLSDDQDKVVKIMHKQTLLLETSIQEMLDMQSIQTQRLVMDIRPSCLTSIVHDATERISPLTTKKNQHIKKIGMSVNIQAFVDPDRTRQILLNLLSNANKYSPRNSQISVTIRCDTEYAEIIVEDEGSGIPDKFLDKACELFFQVPTAGAHLRGTGLGLAIAKEITKTQNGNIHLENRTQGGLRVRVSLPLYSNEPSNSALQNTVLSSTTGET